jgi:hypothetical protein
VNSCVCMYYVYLLSAQVRYCIVFLFGESLYYFILYMLITHCSVSVGILLLTFETIYQY